MLVVRFLVSLYAAEGGRWEIDRELLGVSCQHTRFSVFTDLQRLTTCSVFSCFRSLPRQKSSGAWTRVAPRTKGAKKAGGPCITWATTRLLCGGIPPGVRRQVRFARNHIAHASSVSGISIDTDDGSAYEARAWSSRVIETVWLSTRVANSRRRPPTLVKSEYTAPLMQ